MQRNTFDLRATIFCLVTIAVMSFASAAHACTNPVGVEAEIIMNGDHNVPQYCDGINWIAMSGGDPLTGGGDYVPNVVQFDGVDDYLQQSSELAGVTTGTQATLSFWYRASPLTDDQILGSDGNSYTDIRKGSTDRFIFRFSDGGGTEHLDAQASVIVVADTWYHVLMSFDLSDISKRHIYINDILDSTNWVSYDTAQILDFVGNAGITVGDRSPAAGTSRLMSGQLADLWVDFDRYVDLSIEANRRKFIDENGNPVYLGTNGDLPTGSAPDIFLSGNTASWHINKGTGGGFTENGALTDATTSPYVPRTNVVPSGLVGHWRLDETSGTTAYDSSGNGNDGTMISGLTGSNTIQGVVASALNIPSPAQYIQVPHSASLDITGNQITLASWVNIQSEAFNSIISKRASGVSVYRIDKANNFANWLCEINTTSGTQTVSFAFTGINRWVHVICVYDGANISAYVNGKFEAQAAASGTIVSQPTADVYLGKTLFGFDREILGYMDDMRIYNRALTAAEITELYQARDGIRYNSDFRRYEYFDGNRFVSMTPDWKNVTDGLVGHWKLDETTGTTAAESSGNGNDGTMQNGLDATEDSTSGAVGSSLAFNGIDHDIFVTTSWSNLSQLTYTAWIKPDGWGDGLLGRIIHKGDNSVDPMGGSFLICNASGVGCASSLRFEIGGTVNNGTWHSNNVIALGQWQHVAVSYDKSSTSNVPKLYVNGINIIIDNTNTVTGAFPIDDSNMWIGSRRSVDRFFNGRIDDVRVYDRILSDDEIQQLYQMGAPVGSSTALPQGCPNIGDVCDNGTVYAGLSPDGNVEMFVPTLDNQPISRLWNENVTHTNYSDTGATNNSAGETNTNTIVTVDADTTVAGFQVHRAAQYCYNLVLHGTDDWYLPSINELSTIYTNRTGNMNIDNSIHWSSSQSSQNTARTLSFSDGVINQFSTKNTNRRVKCLRKGPAPRCANPYGVEGAMLYNTDYDIVQYCDGARWIAIGKYGP